MEGAGNYGRGLAQYLVGQGETVYDINPRWTAQGRRQARRTGKNGRLDAHAVVLVVWREATTLPALTAENETAALRLHVVVLMRLEAIPGVGRRTAEILVAEIGVDVSRFPSAGHLASWAGMCPGQHESAGKDKRGKRRHGNMALRRALTEAAKAAARTKKDEQTYLRGRYRRLVARCGKKKAAIAVGHTILRIVYYVLATGEPYRDPRCSWLATSAGARTSSIARLRNFKLWATR